MFGFLVFLSIVLLGAAAQARLGRQSRILQRMAPTTASGTAMSVLLEVSGDSLALRLAQPLARLLGRLGGVGIGRRRNVAALRDRLVLAGEPGHLSAEEFFALSLGLGVLVGLLAVPTLAVQGPMGVVEGGMAGFVSFRLPSIWLSRRIASRQREVQRDLLGWMDQLATVAEAGASLPEAVRRVSESMDRRGRHSLLAYEASRAWGEAQAGGDLGSALSRVADRLGVDELRYVISMLRQQLALGTGIARTIRTQTRYLRQQRGLRVEEAAQKATPKLLLPTLMVLGVTGVVVLYPALQGTSGIFGH